MTSVQGYPKRELQSHVLGVLSVYAMSSAASAMQHRFTYKVLSTVVCKAVFIEAYAVSNFAMKKLQALAEFNCATCIRSCTEDVDFCPFGWPTVRKRSNNTSTWGVARIILESVKLNKACVRTIQHNFTVHHITVVLKFVACAYIHI